MALPPPPMPPPGGGAPPMPPGAGAMAPPPGGAPPPDDGDDGGDDVICTIVQNTDGTFTVYAGDEPEGGSGDMSDDDTSAMGAGGDMTAPQGTPADSTGAVLKAVKDILDAAGTGGPGGAEAQFSAGFGGAPAGGGAPPGP